MSLKNRTQEMRESKWIQVIGRDIQAKTAKADKDIK